MQYENKRKKISRPIHFFTEYSNSPIEFIWVLDYYHDFNASKCFKNNFFFFLNYPFSNGINEEGIKIFRIKKLMLLRNLSLNLS